MTKINMLQFAYRMTPSPKDYSIDSVLFNLKNQIIIGIK
jgi:hypothetical protein